MPTRGDNIDLKLCKGKDLISAEYNDIRGGLIGINFLLKLEEALHGQKEIVDDGCGWIPFVVPLAALSERCEFVILDARL